MSDALSVTVKWDPMTTSGNARMHHMARYKAEQEAKALGRLAWRQAGCPTVTGPVRLSLVVRRARGMDLQNAWGGVKGVIDGLFTEAITPNDGRNWIAELGGVRMETHARYRGAEEVVFIIEPVALPLSLAGGRKRGTGE